MSEVLLITVLGTIAIALAVNAAALLALLRRTRGRR